MTGAPLCDARNDSEPLRLDAADCPVTVVLPIRAAGRVPVNCDVATGCAAMLDAVIWTVEAPWFPMTVSAPVSGVVAAGYEVIGPADAGAHWARNSARAPTNKRPMRGPRGWFGDIAISPDGGGKMHQPHEAHKALGPGRRGKDRQNPHAGVLGRGAGLSVHKDMVRRHDQAGVVDHAGLLREEMERGSVGTDLAERVVVVRDKDGLEDAAVGRRDDVSHRLSSVALRKLSAQLQPFEFVGVATSE